MAGFLRTGPAGKAALLAGLLLLAGQLAAPGATAQTERRLDATSMSCAALQEAIAASGAAIVRSRSPYSATLLSERYVSRRGFCFQNETFRYRTVIAADTDRCTVRLCVESGAQRTTR